MITIYKTNNEHWLDNSKMAISDLNYSVECLTKRINNLYKCSSICNENKLEQMYNKLEQAERLLYEANAMGLREDN